MPAPHIHVGIPVGERARGQTQQGVSAVAQRCRSSCSRQDKQGHKKPQRHPKSNAQSQRRHMRVQLRAQNTSSAQTAEQPAADAKLLLLSSQVCKKENLEMNKP